MELGRIKLTWTEIGTLYGKRLFLCDQIVKTMPFGETSDYETSDVRRWLNGDFLESFSGEEKAKLEPFSLTDKGDKIFLLSEKEYTMCEKEIVDAGAVWWLRSSGGHADSAAYVSLAGGIIYCYVSIAYVGVRPACLMD